MIPLLAVSGGPELEPAPRNIGRYLLFREIGHGGMATVHLGRLHGPAGFARTVAIKRLHAHYARDPEFVSMFLDEARLAARIQHPNVVSVLDVVASEGELFLIMDYVHGESLFKLFRSAAATKTPIPRRIFVSIITGVLYGLDAAHDARSDLGTPLEIVHRDVSPQNVLLGIDGISRLLDFGVAKASQRVHLSTQDGKLKGKLSYMAPEQVSTGIVDRRADVYAAGVMLWEGLTGQRLHKPDEVGVLIGKILSGEISPPSSVAKTTPRELDVITMKALARSPNDRYETAREMATALERAIPPATPRQIGEWVAKVASAELKERADTIAKIEGRAAPEGRSSDFHMPAVRPKTTDAASKGSEERRIPSLVDDSSLTPTKQAPEKAPSEPEISVELEGPASKSSTSAAKAGEVPPAEISEVSASEMLPLRSASIVAGSEVGDSAGESSAALAVPGVSTTKRRAAAAIVVAALLVVGFVIEGRSCGAKTAPTTAQVPTPSTSVAALASIYPLPPVPSSSKPPVFIAGDAPTHEPTPVTTTPTATTPATTSKPASTRTVTRRDPKSCDPPYTIDSSGVRVPKRQCL